MKILIHTKNSISLHHKHFLSVKRNNNLWYVYLLAHNSTISVIKMYFFSFSFNYPYSVIIKALFAITAEH